MGGHLVSETGQSRLQVKETQIKGGLKGGGSVVTQSVMEKKQTVDIWEQLMLNLFTRQSLAVVDSPDGDRL